MVSNDPREDSWAAAIDPTGAVLDHLQIPRQRDAKAKKLKVSQSLPLMSVAVLMAPLDIIAFPTSDVT